MLGLFPKIFLDFLAKENGVGAANILLRTVGINRLKGFHERKIYPDKEWQDLFKASCEKLGIAPEIVETAFAHYFCRFIREHQKAVYSAFLDSRSLIESLPAIHTKIVGRTKKSRSNQYNLDKLRIEQKDSKVNVTVIRYRSPNKLCRFLEVLVKDIIRFYGDQARIEHMAGCMKLGDPECEIRILWKKP
jgi:DNA-binding Xre family transcriptional regulator